MSDVVIRVENISKLYRLGEVGTGSLAHDVNRWWHRVRGKEDPYLKIGEVNDRTKPAKQASSKKSLTTEDTESTEGAAGVRLAGQAGAAFPNPSTSELASDSENTSLIRAANEPRFSGQRNGSGDDAESQKADPSGVWFPFHGARMLNTRPIAQSPRGRRMCGPGWATGAKRSTS
jgi:hypothetical protein